MPAQAVSGRVGYVMSRKVLSRAVDRNRLKRRLRAFLRTQPSAVRFDIVVRVKRKVERDMLDEVFREATALIAKAMSADAAAPAR